MSFDLYDPFNPSADRKFQRQGHDQEFNFRAAADPVDEDRDAVKERVVDAFTDQFGRWLDDHWGTEKEPGQPEEKKKSAFPGWGRILI